MNPRRGRAVALTLAALGVCVLLACVVVFKDVAAEWWGTCAVRSSPPPDVNVSLHLFPRDTMFMKAPGGPSVGEVVMRGR